MKPKIFTSQAIVLSKKNYSDTDRILTFYTRDYGKVTLIAKGVRKLTSRKRGKVEVFSTIKFSAARGRNLDILSEVESVESFNYIKTSLKKSALAYYMLELINKITQPEEVNRELFDFAVSYFGKVNRETKLKKIRYDFVYELLVLMGFWQKGKEIKNLDSVVENVLEREITSKRVGKIVLS